MSEKPFDKTAYKNKFIAENYDRINLTVPKGTKNIIQEHVSRRGESVNAFINRAITETMELDKTKSTTQEETE